jgi:hypothetical protein
MSDGRNSVCAIQKVSCTTGLRACWQSSTTFSPISRQNIIHSLQLSALLLIHLAQSVAAKLASIYEGMHGNRFKGYTQNMHPAAEAVPHPLLPMTSNP